MHLGDKDATALLASLGENQSLKVRSEYASILCRPGPTQPRLCRCVYKQLPPCDHWLSIGAQQAPNQMMDPACVTNALQGLDLSNNDLGDKSALTLGFVMMVSLRHESVTYQIERCPCAG